MVLRLFNPRTLGAVLAAGLLAIAGEDLGEAAKAKPRSRPPDLRIVSVNAEPVPFVPNDVPMTLTIKVELPKVIPEDAILDVSTLITSVTRSSFRLLSSRQVLPTTEEDDEEAAETPRLLEIVQTWDGTDNYDRVVVEGIYDYQVQAKLMVMSKSGAPLTRLSAWKKRGNFEVKAAPTAQTD